MGDYHLGAGSPASNAGAASKVAPSYQAPPASIAAPAFDIDLQGRPSFGSFDIGADEVHQTTADLSITKSDGVTSVAPGGAVHYTIVAGNLGPDAAGAAAVADTVPASLGSVTWTCTASAGSTCGAASGSGSIATTATLAAGGSATFLLNGTVGAAATGSLVNTATITVPAGTLDTNAANNSATDSDTIAPAIPTLAILDTFDRANANTLGGNWSQVTIGGAAAIRVNANQASCPTGLTCLIPGQAIWNVPAAGFGNRQGAAFTFANAPVNGTALILKATGGSASLPTSFIRVMVTGTTVVVATTTNAGLTFTTRATFTGATFASGNVLTAVALNTGAVTVFRTAGATVTQIGTVAIPGVGFWTGTGRIGIRLTSGARIDNFAGGTVP
jgi:uncharacterized repeat protein (TIGR01451 family)